MCVIISRPSGTEFDFDDMKIACTKNADGFGIMFTDRGKLEIIKEFDPKGNDPEKVLRYMEEAKNHDVFVHLRLRSVGNKDASNCHPFLVYNEDGEQYALMHNGTMASYDRKDGRTDSEVWGQEILLPFIQHWATEGALLDDVNFRRMLSRLTPSGNKIAILSNDGKSFIINRADGSIRKGCWVSNDYSFQDYGGYIYNSTKTSGGASSTVPFRTTTSASGQSQSATTAQGTLTAQGHSSAEGSPADAKTSSGVGQTTILGKIKAANEDAMAHKYTTIGSVDPTKDKYITPVVRPSFLEVSGFQSFEDLTKFSREDFQEMCKEFPEEMSYLIVDLLIDWMDSFADEEAGIGDD